MNKLGHFAAVEKSKQDFNSQTFSFCMCTVSLEKVKSFYLNFVVRTKPSIRLYPEFC